MNKRVLVKRLYCANRKRDDDDDDELQYYVMIQMESTASQTDRSIKRQRKKNDRCKRSEAY